MRLLVEPREEGNVVVLTCAALLYGFSSASLFWKARQLAYSFVKYGRWGATPGHLSLVSPMLQFLFP